jgi:hypothetical protein
MAGSVIEPGTPTLTYAVTPTGSSVARADNAPVRSRSAGRQSPMQYYYSSMMRCALLGICVLLLAGCSDDDVTVKGSPSDVKTVPGTYDGYVIIDQCQLPSIAYGALGVGSSWYAGVAPGDAGRSDALVELARDVVKPALTNVASVDGVGIGTSCTLDAGVIVIMSDWRDADRVLTRAGQALAEGDLREEVAILVTIASAH